MARERRKEITLAGFTFVCVSGVVLMAAINSASNLLFIIFGVMVGMMLAAVGFSRRSLHRLEVTRTAPDHVVAGEAAELEYRVDNRKPLWPTFALRVEELDAPAPVPAAFFMHLPRRSGATAFARLVAPRRGLLTLSRVGLRSSFPLGFLARRRIVRLPGQIVVYPRVGTLHRKLALAYRDVVEAGTMTSNRRGGNDEFYGLREYRPGDNIRAIHWRSTARTGNLMVRELTANAPPQMIIVLNLRRWRDFPEGREQAERAIELAATIACDGFLENFAVGLGIAGMDCAAPAPLMAGGGRGARPAMLRRLAVLDLDHVAAEMPLPLPNRLASRAEWVVINLRRSDPYKDLLAGSASSRAMVLSLDDGEASSWIHYLTGAETSRLLREPAA